MDITFVIRIYHTDNVKVDGVMVLLIFPSEIKVHPANLNLGNAPFRYIATAKPERKREQRDLRCLT